MNKRVEIRHSIVQNNGWNLNTTVRKYDRHRIEFFALRRYYLGIITSELSLYLALSTLQFLDFLSNFISVTPSNHPYLQ
jgi:hypothetical protein